MYNWSWKEGFVFACAKKLLSPEGAVPYTMSTSERLGSQILKPLYRMIAFVSKKIGLPVAICLFTLLASLILLVVFYNIPAFIILGKLFPSWVVRFAFFCYVELNLFALGCMAFGRFNNNALVKLWKSGKLIAVLPGDNEPYTE